MCTSYLLTKLTFLQGTESQKVLRHVSDGQKCIIQNKVDLNLETTLLQNKREEAFTYYTSSGQKKTLLQNKREEAFTYYTTSGQKNCLHNIFSTHVKPTMT